MGQANYTNKVVGERWLNGLGVGVQVLVAVRRRNEASHEPMINYSCLIMQLNQAGEHNSLEYLYKEMWSNVRNNSSCEICSYNISIYVIVVGLSI